MHVWYVDAGIEDTPEPVYTHCLVYGIESAMHPGSGQDTIPGPRVRTRARMSALSVESQSVLLRVMSNTVYCKLGAGCFDVVRDV